MSLDKLLVIFIIIILPIAFILNVYVNSQADTLSMQSLYDGKLYNATNDALKAYQSNSFNEDLSNITESKMRNIEASANVFLNSIANNFSMQGFSSETLQSHIPALVFTMYDGYYIYSKYNNTENGDLIYGVKPYIHYSCRYKRDNNKRGKNDDFVITYSLDNYIAIQGIVNGEWVNDAGYVIDTNNLQIIDSENVQYRGINIQPENFLVEYVGTTPYRYVKENGTKYYYDQSNRKWFSLINGKKTYTGTNYSQNNNSKDYSAYNYYKSAYDFTNRLINEYGLGDLKPSNAVEAYNTSVNPNNDETFYEYNFYTTNPNANIFQLSSANGTSIEERASNFNEHRLAVIRYSIEKNLSIAIANYNTYSGGVSTNFQMPVLNETEWDKILNNITLISFMQGIPMGNKTYNGCAVVQNNKNGEVVAEDSIYIVNMNGSLDINRQGSNSNREQKYYYDVKKKNLKDEISSPVGILNIDLEKRYYYDENSSSVQGDYYYPKLYYADYTSVITKKENVNISAETTDNNYKYSFNGSIYKYLDEISKDDAGKNIAKAYYTALGRERYSTYKIQGELK